MSGTELTFLGTGEAFDADRPHTSLLLRTEDTCLLLDCGALVPPRLWSRLHDASVLHGVWISHLHADHAFGIPLLLGRMWEERRTEPLTFLGAAGIAERAGEILDRGYPGMRQRLEFELREQAIEPGAESRFRDLGLRSAATRHSLRNLALRVALPGEAALVYSGDGEPTEESALLGEGAHWVHECFAVSESIPGHASLDGLARQIRRQRPVRMGLVHVSRHHRRAMAPAAEALASQGLPVHVVETGDRWDL